MVTPSEIYLLLYFLAAIGSIATPVAIWQMCAVLKKGLNEHVSTMQLIYQEMNKTNQFVNHPATRPIDAS